MALTDENGGLNLSMPVAPAYGGGGFGGFGNGDWSWIIILLLFGLFGNGGWGNGFGGGIGGDLYPWINQSNQISDGFQNAQLHDSVTSVRDGISALSTQLCGCCGDTQMALANGFSGTTAAITGAQNALAQQMYANELASLNRSFAEQTANTAGFTGVNSGIADLRYTVATEACADRAAVSDALRDVIAANTASTQRILDQLCADKLEQKNDEIARLRQEINMQALAASQAAQTAQILAGQSAEIDGVYNRLKNCPVGTYNVCNPLTPAYSGCGCGGGFAN